jgi:hypothetical protein
MVGGFAGEVPIRFDMAIRFETDSIFVSAAGASRSRRGPLTETPRLERGRVRAPGEQAGPT